MSTDPKNTPPPPNEEQKLSNQLSRREVDDATWNTLKNSIFPGASAASILMAVDYCIARKLDVLKKPCHIVPMEVKTGKKDQDGWDIKEWRDIIMPGIYELRTTAMRTGQYAGCSDVEFGATIDYLGVKAPESARMVVYRFAKNGEKIPFPATVYFEEACATTGKGDKKKVNAMWTKRTRGQMDKCAEAAALRKAFPEELGGIQSADEMAGQVLGDAVDAGVVAEQQPGSRTEQAKANLQRSLTDQKGTGGLDLPLNKGTDAEAIGRELAGQRQMDSARREQLAADVMNREFGGGAPDREQRTFEESKRADGVTPAFKFDIPAALAYLRSKTTVAHLRKAYQEIEDDFEFSGREMPIDVEAVYRDIREDLEGQERA
jgi:phage recombination protein Bet